MNFPAPKRKSNGLFRLLLPAGQGTDCTDLPLELNGQSWRLTEFTQVPETVGAPEYTCISYAWGPERVASPIHLEFEGGYFFPRSRGFESRDVMVLASTGVTWPHGAPGLLVNASDSGLHRYLDTGVFVGPIPKSGTAFNIG